VGKVTTADFLKCGIRSQAYGDACFKIDPVVRQRVIGNHKHRLISVRISSLILPGHEAEVRHRASHSTAGPAILLRKNQLSLRFPGAVHGKHKQEKYFKQ
jgi:hypothetical protein